MELIAVDGRVNQYDEQVLLQMKSHVQMLCNNLTEKIYMQFLSSFQDQLVFIISQIFAKEGFASCTDEASIEAWSQATKA